MQSTLVGFCAKFKPLKGFLPDIAVA